MIKTREQLDKKYDWRMQVLIFINTDMMSSYGDPDNFCKNYSEIAKSYAEEKTLYEEGIEDYLQSITDLQLIAEKELVSWEVIGNAAYTGLDGRDDAKKWLGDEVIPALVAEAEKRGWKKPA